jgi:hypothetical protein
MSMQGTARNEALRASRIVIALLAFRPEFKAKVRSMGGWTREYFGGL